MPGRPLRSLITSLVVCVLAPSCVASGDDPARTEADVSVRVSRAAVLGTRLGVAALVRTTGDSAVGPVGIRAELMDGAGRRVGIVDVGGLPFCLPRRSCWWATVVPGASAGPAWKSVRSADVEATPLRGGAAPDRAAIRAFEVRREADGGIVGSTPARPDGRAVEGYAYILSGPRGEPAAGTVIERIAGEVTTVSVSPDELPRAGPDEELRGVFYAGPVARG